MTPGLNNLHIVGHPGIESLSRQVQRFSCHLNVPLGYFHLTCCRSKIEISIPHCTFHLAPGVFEFGLPLGQECLSLRDIALRATSQPNLNIEGGSAGIRRVSFAAGLFRLLRSRRSRKVRAGAHREQRQECVRQHESALPTP